MLGVSADSRRCVSLHVLASWTLVGRFDQAILEEVEVGSGGRRRCVDLRKLELMSRSVQQRGVFWNV